MRTGCWPLTKPQHADFDPMMKRSWNLLMALTWIITRDSDAVRAVWDEYRGACFEWVAHRTLPRRKKSWELEPHPPMTWQELSGSGEEILPPPTIMSPQKAYEDLWTKLRAGQLVAEGKRHGTEIVVTIPPAEWEDLDFMSDPEIAADCICKLCDDAPRYDSVRVVAWNVRQIWRPLEELESGEFLREDWSIDHVTLWIAYRDRSLFHFINLRNDRSTGRLSEAHLRDPAPAQTLLQALKVGTLAAIRKGKEVAAEEWFGSELLDEDQRTNRVCFRRRDVLQVWKELEENLPQRMGILLEQLRHIDGKQPSQKRCYEFLRKQNCKGVTHKSVRDLMEQKWGKGKKGRRAFDPR